MPQFDVHRNTGRHRTTIPFVLVVQSSLFDRYRRRVVVPLVRTTDIADAALARGSRMNPIFVVTGIEVVLHPLEIVSVAVDQLGELVTSLADRGSEIADALDEILTRSWSQRVESGTTRGSPGAPFMRQGHQRRNDGGLESPSLAPH